MRHPTAASRDHIPPHLRALRHAEPAAPGTMQGSCLTPRRSPFPARSPLLGWTLSASLVALMPQPSAQAQALPGLNPALPNAGSTLRDIERSTPTGKPAATDGSPSGLSITPTLPQAPASADERRITVRSFDITGVTAVDVNELLPMLDEWRHRELTLAELQKAAAKITEFYRERGYRVARAYLPQQSIRSGIIQIAVLEGELGSIKLKNETRISDDRILALASGVKPGEKMYVPAVERRLLLLKDTPGVANVEAALQPGENVGQTDMVVKVDPAPLVTGAIDADNAGNRYVGAYRVGGTLKLNSPLGLGDQLVARAQVSNAKLYAGSLSYRVPVMSDGLVVGAAFASSHYQIGKDFAALDANGQAMSASLFATYPFVRSETFNLIGGLSTERRRLRDNIGLFDVQSKKNLSNVGANLSANGQLGNGTYAASVAYTTGKLNIDTPDVQLADALTVKSAGNYNKIGYALSTVQPMAGPWSVSAAFSGQFASKNLDASEKFSVGGADGVRAYPQGEAPSDEAYLLTSELRYALPDVPRGAMQVLGFVDHASVSLYKNPFIPADNRRRLSAVGLGWTWQVPGDFAIRFSVAKKVGKTPATSDHDASVRAWIQGVKYFNGF